MEVVNGNCKRDVLQYVQITAAAAQGGRKYMEDRIHIEAVRDEQGSLDHIFTAIYDGHGGIFASQYAKEHLHKNIIVVHHWPMTASGFPCTAGTTASIAILRDGKVYTGHVGDSAVFIARLRNPDKERVVQLTEDHKPETPKEKERIERVGGEVIKKGDVFRVVWKRTARNQKEPVCRSQNFSDNIPFLAVARALGERLKIFLFIF